MVERSVSDSESATHPEPLQMVSSDRCLKASVEDVLHTASCGTGVSTKCEDEGAIHRIEWSPTICVGEFAKF